MERRAEMPKVILLTGFVLFFCGLALFGTETAFQFTLSLFLLATGYTMIRWITLRYDFSAEDK